MPGADGIPDLLDGGSGASDLPGLGRVGVHLDGRLRELAEAIHRQLGRGEVRFDVDRGGAGQSLTGDPGKMVQLFGPPQVSLEVVISRAVKAVG